MLTQVGQLLISFSPLITQKNHWQYSWCTDFLQAVWPSGYTIKP